jgi:hypothetical protein
MDNPETEATLCTRHRTQTKRQKQLTKLSHKATRIQLNSHGEPRVVAKYLKCIIHVKITLKHSISFCCIKRVYIKRGLK